jgi:hypothetical protein
MRSGTIKRESDELTERYNGKEKVSRNEETRAK